MGREDSSELHFRCAGKAQNDYDPQLYLNQPADTGSYPPDMRSAFPADMLKASSEYEYLPFGK